MEENGKRQTIESRIGAARLTLKDQAAIDYIMKNKKKACYQAAAEIAAQIGISPSSVVRVSARLGFESYGAFKRQLQQEVAGEEEETPVFLKRVEDIDSLSEESLVVSIQKNSIRNLRIDAENTDIRTYRKAADLMCRGERVFLAGFRACAGFALTFATNLSCIRPGVTAVTGALPVVDTLIDLTERDTVIILSYSRYSSDAVYATAMARRAGSHIVAITDSYAAPVCQGAEAIIINSPDNLSFYNSYVGLTMTIEILTGLASQKNKEQNRQRLMKMEEYLRETGQY